MKAKMYSQVRPDWKRIEGTRDYACQRTGYIAVFVRMDGPWGVFSIFAPDGTLYTTSGLPNVLHLET